jgi:Tol biopolymer transport system component
MATGILTLLGAILRAGVLLAASVTGMSLIAVGGGQWWQPWDVLLFSMAHDGPADIYIADTAGRTVNLTRTPYYESVPVWSPSGDQIAFVSNQAGNREIYIMDQFGQNIRRITSTNAEHEALGWSPDGRYLTYALAPRNYPNQPEVFVMELATGEVRNLTENPPPAVSFGRAPRWAPDSDTLAYKNEMRPEWIVAALPFGEVLLANVPNMPTFSPDASQIAYVDSFDSFNPLLLNTIYVQDVASGDLINRVETDYEFLQSLAWSPERDQIAFIGTQGTFGGIDLVSIALIHPETGTTRHLATFENANNRVTVNRLQWSHDGERLSFFISNPEGWHLCHITLHNTRQGCIPLPDAPFGQSWQPQPKP